MNPYERVMAAVNHKKADRVPVFLFFTFYGAKKLGISIPEYFSRSENIVKGQKILLEQFGHDCLYPFSAAAFEAAAFGQKIEFYEDGPPNAGQPIIKSRRDIFRLRIPDPLSCRGLEESLKAVSMLAKEFKKQVPVISAVIAPFSLPIMLMGLKLWLEIIIDDDWEAITQMAAKSTSFCLTWANLLFDAGADIIGFFEPFATSTMITREEFLKYIFEADKGIISQIKGPVGFCGAGGRLEPVIDKIAELGVAGCLISADDDLKSIKKNFGDKINLMGNLNNISMIDWDYDTAKREAQKCLEAAGNGGGFILADQHGEISWQVKEVALAGIVDAARS
jgi:uroporphyrinogen decarboxylase